MYYKIYDGKLEELDVERWQESTDGIAVFTSDEWKSDTDFSSKYMMNQQHENIHFCKLERYADYLFGTFHIPMKKKYGKNIEFIFYIVEGKIIFIDNSGLVKNSMKNILLEKLRREYTVKRFFYDFLISLIENDLIHLEDIERDIAKIEEGILKGKVEKFNSKMMPIKKEISRLHRYYSQLSDIGESLIDNESDFFKEDQRTRFQLFKERAERLQEETKILREYAMQVQEVYQSEIGIQQNDIMKVLTIVTTVFLPLTLIVGWYGMNFIDMPELQWSYGYECVIAISVLIVILSLWFFKKKKFW